MDSEDFRKWSRRAADWGADYRGTLRDRPVRAADAARRHCGADCASRAGAAGADGEDLRRFRARHRARHDALAASALLRLFPGQRRAGFGRGGISRQRHGRAMHAVADVARRDRARDEGDRLAAPGARPARRPLRASSRIPPRRRRFRPYSPCASVRWNGPATDAASPASRACGSIPPTRSTPR